MSILRDRPAAIPVHVKHMGDTSNFDDFEMLDEQKKCECLRCPPHPPNVSTCPSHPSNSPLIPLTPLMSPLVPLTLLMSLLVPLHLSPSLRLSFTAFSDEGESQKDWVFQNYTFKRFEGLTQRGHLKP